LQDLNLQNSKQIWKDGMEIRVTTDLGDFFDGVLRPTAQADGFGIKLLIHKDNVKTFIKLDYSKRIFYQCW
jgi:hypothetical protein